MKLMLKGLTMLSCLGVMTSCVKKPVVQDFTSTEDQTTVTVMEKAAVEEADLVAMRPTSNCNYYDHLPSCVVVTESGETFPKEITVDFGEGCTDYHGREKKGIIRIVLTDEMLNDGATRTVTFENYSINNKTITGTRKLVNTGVDDQGHPKFSREVDFSVTTDRGVISRTSSGTVTWMSGYDTEVCGDNVFEVIGAGQTVRPNGKVISGEVVEPLLVDRTCGYVTQGVLRITGENKERTVDFGDGECDHVATVTTAEGEIREIDLNNRRVRH